MYEIVCENCSIWVLKLLISYLMIKRDFLFFFDR
jgi:hypothetical protein